MYFLQNGNFKLSDLTKTDIFSTLNTWFYQFVLLSKTQFYVISRILPLKKHYFLDFLLSQQWLFWKNGIFRTINFRVGQFIVRCEIQLENSIANQRLIGVQGLPKPNWHAYQTNAQVIKWYIPRMNSSWKITLKSLGWFF